MEGERVRSEILQRVLASAAELQRVIPDAVLVGGTAAALYAQHRDSFDHDHVLVDLRERYAEILATVEATDGWATSVRASSPPMTLLGSLGGIEAGLRQLRRSRPLEVETHQVAPEAVVRVPTRAEMLRVKAYLVVMRNQVRDYLDVAALAEMLGHGSAADVLLTIDDYYVDRSQAPDSVLTALIQRLAEPDPRDTRVTRQLASYKGLDPRWQTWEAVVGDCADLADTILDRLADR